MLIRWCFAAALIVSAQAVLKKYMDVKITRNERAVLDNEVRVRATKPINTATLRSHLEGASRVFSNGPSHQSLPLLVHQPTGMGRNNLGHYAHETSDGITSIVCDLSEAQHDALLRYYESTPDDKEMAIPIEDEANDENSTRSPT